MAQRRKAAKRKTKPAVEKIVAFPDKWKTDFVQSSFRTRFNLSLSQPMLEFICAVADGVDWDRSHCSTIHCPDNFIGTGRCLEKRGLVYHYQSFNQQEREAYDSHHGDIHEVTCWKLTPAGEKLVDLLKVVGVFVEADSAITKKARRKC